MTGISWPPFPEIYQNQHEARPVPGNYNPLNPHEDSLGGTAKTLMFVNCSPADSNVDETKMSLMYATRAKKITNKR